VEAGWWLIPVGLLTAWVVFSTALLVSDMVSAANIFGLLDGGTTVFVSNPSNNAAWTSAMERFGLLKGDSLQWVGRTESYTRNVLPQYIWQVSIAMLYLTWIAIWWARHTRQGQAPLLEG
jgi:hypothetical protein